MNNVLLLEKILSELDVARSPTSFTEISTRVHRAFSFLPIEEKNESELVAALLRTVFRMLKKALSRESSLQFIEFWIFGIVKYFASFFEMQSLHQQAKVKSDFVSMISELCDFASSSKRNQLFGRCRESNDSEPFENVLEQLVFASWNEVRVDDSQIVTRLFQSMLLVDVIDAVAKKIVEELLLDDTPQSILLAKSKEFVDVIERKLDAAEFSSLENVTLLKKICGE